MRLIEWLWRLPTALSLLVCGLLSLCSAQLRADPVITGIRNTAYPFDVDAGFAGSDSMQLIGSGLPAGGTVTITMPNFGTSADTTLDLGTTFYVPLHPIIHKQGSSSPQFTNLTVVGLSPSYSYSVTIADGETTSNSFSFKAIQEVKKTVGVVSACGGPRAESQMKSLMESGRPYIVATGDTSGNSKNEFLEGETLRVYGLNLSQGSLSVYFIHPTGSIQATPSNMSERSLDVVVPTGLAWIPGVKIKVTGGPALSGSHYIQTTSNYCTETMVSGTTVTHDPSFSNEWGISVSEPCTVQITSYPQSLINPSVSASFTATVDGGQSASSITWDGRVAAPAEPHSLGTGSTVGVIFEDDAPELTNQSQVIIRASHPAGCDVDEVVVAIDAIPPPCVIAISSPVTAAVTSASVYASASVSGTDVTTVIWSLGNNPITSAVPLGDYCCIEATLRVKGLDSGQQPIAGCEDSEDIVIAIPGHPNNIESWPGFDIRSCLIGDITPIRPEMLEREKEQNEYIQAGSCVDGSCDRQFRPESTYPNPVVHLPTGRNVIQRTDLGFKTRGEEDFSVSRYYDSRFGRDPLQGVGHLLGNWSMNWEGSIRLVDGIVIETTPNFESKVYLPLTSGMMMSSIIGDIGVISDLPSHASLRARVASRKAHRRRRRKNKKNEKDEGDDQDPPLVLLSSFAGDAEFLTDPRTGEWASENEDGSISITSLTGAVRTYDTTTGRLASTEDRSGNTFTLSYGATGFLTSVTDPVGRLVTFATDSVGRVTAVTIPGEAGKSTWAYHYTTQGFLDIVYDPLGKATVFEYDGQGRVTRRLNANAEEVLWGYDSDGRLASSTTPEGSQASFAYFSDRTEVTDANGKTTKYYLDDEGQITRIVWPDSIGERQFGWGSAGQMLATTNELGNETTYTYAGALVETMSTPLSLETTVYRNAVSGAVDYRADPDSAITTSSFDASGNATGYTDPLGESYAFEYDQYGQLTKISQPTGQETTFAYDQYGNRTRITNHEGKFVEMAYDSLSRVTSITDELGNETTVEYLLHGLPSVIENALGATTEFEYDDLYRPSSVVDEEGARTQTARQSVGGLVLVTSTLDALYQETRYEHDEAGRLTATVSPDGARWETDYDSLGRPIKARDPLDNETVTEYYADGSVRKVTDPTGRITEFFYDADGRMIRVKNYKGTLVAETITEHDSVGRVIRTSDALEGQTYFTYDSAGRLVRTTDSEGGTVEREYDKDGRLKAVSNERGFVTTYGYDNLGRPTSVTQEVGDGTEIVTTTEYDDASRVSKITDPEGRETTFQYDLLGRRTVVTSSLGYSVITSYNADGTIQHIEDPNGNITWFVYDELKREIVKIDPLGFSVETEYDSVGNRTAVIDENGNSVHFSYDLAGRLIAEIDANSEKVQFEYDDAGRLTKTINARGMEVTRTYDGLGRLTSVVTPDETDTFQYDLLDRMVSAVNSTVAVTWTHDSLGRVLLTTDSRGMSVQTSYDAKGNPVEVTDSEGHIVARVFDGLGRVTKIIDPRSGEFDFTYDKSGLVQTLSRPNGVLTSWTYDNDRRTTLVAHKRASDSSVLLSFEYGYDPSGNRIREVETRGSEVFRTNYQYDARDQLVLVNRALPRRLQTSGEYYYAYKYDPAGNVLERKVNSNRETFFYNNLNQIVRTGDGLDFEYDQDGNLVYQPVGDTRSRYYRYDARNQMVRTWVEEDPRRSRTLLDREPEEYHEDSEECLGASSFLRDELESPAGKKRVEILDFSYDPLSRKIQSKRSWNKDASTAKSLTEDRFWSGNEIVEERKSSSSTSGYTASTYLTEGMLLLEEVASRKIDGSKAELVKRDRFPLQDVLGRTMARAYGSGYPGSISSYRPHGEQIEGDTDSPFTLFGHHREFTDVGDSELYSAQFRHVRPVLMRWTSKDPGGDVDDHNRYTYLQNNPTYYIDPNGEFVLQILVGFGLGVWIGGGTIQEAGFDIPGFDNPKSTAGQPFPNRVRIAAERCSVALAPIVGMPRGLASIYEGVRNVPTILVNGTRYIIYGGSTTAAANEGLRGIRRSVGAGGDDYLLRKAINSNLPHAAKRAVERGLFDSAKAAAEALRALTRQITTSGFPRGTLVDPDNPGRFLVPFGNGGYAVYQLLRNGTARLKTVLIAR